MRDGLAKVEGVDIRAFSTNKHRTVDDVPFGGGAGMVMKPEPVAKAIESVGPVAKTVLLTPSGRTFKQADAAAWSKLDSMLLVCGRYEGIDQRIRDNLVDDAVSIGDYVLSGGELGALVVLDATLRLVPGVLGNAESVRHESHSANLLEHPHIRGLPSGVGIKFRRCCSVGTTEKLESGAVSKRSSGPLD